MRRPATIVSVTDTAERTAVEAAYAAAHAAAERADVAVRELASAEDATAASQLFAAIWSQDAIAGMAPEMIRALIQSGNCTLGAFDGDELVGSAVGFLGRHDGVDLHSHVLGVDLTQRHRSIGYALKLAQRAWALQRGIDMIRWTTDPLVRRNAYFNLMKLAARITSYDVNFYGAQVDAINYGDESDRILLAWDLCAPATQRACTQAPERLDAAELRGAGAATVLDADDLGEPRIGDPAEDGQPVLVFVPEDVVAMRQSDPERARRWRRALRTALVRELGAGRNVAGITHDGYYLMHGS